MYIYIKYNASHSSHLIINFDEYACSIWLSSVAFKKKPGLLSPKTLEVSTNRLYAPGNWLFSERIAPLVHEFHSWWKKVLMLTGRR
jgi:hypothetical protein